MPQDVVSLLQALIRIPSVNPDNTPATSQTGEAGIADFLKCWLEAIGAEVFLEEIQPGRPNLIARFAPLDGRRRILLGPHMDTVGIEGMVVDPFSGDVHGGKIWGRGSSDTKGPMAAMLWALAEHQKLLADSSIAIDFVAFMGEETCQSGSKHFVKHHGSDYEFALVGEPTSMQLVHVTKGSLWATLRATGKAAHSSMPECGENAIIKLCQALDQLDRHLNSQLATFRHPLLGHATMNVGTIRGGSRPNIVPDLAEAMIDIRTTPALAETGGALDLLKRTIALQDLPLEIVSAYENPPMETSAEQPMIRALMKLDPSCQLTGAPWFSDAAHLSHGGIPSICIGPGSIEQAHTIDEFIEIAALQQGSEIFSKFIHSLVKVRTPCDLS